MASCPTAGCSSPRSPAACASTPTASCPSRSAACRRWRIAARAACSTSRSIPTSRATGSSTSPTPRRPSSSPRTRATRGSAFRARTSTRTTTCSRAAPWRAAGWTGAQLRDVKVIWRQVPKTIGRGHFGGRLVFAPDGKLFITSGERQRFEPAQDRATNLGKIVRINPDGSIPTDNPFVGKAGARPDIWSLGHRNPLGAAIHPASRQLWIHEMGPLARRRDQHPGARQELRLAGREQRRQLRRQPDPRSSDAARVRRAGLLLAPGDLAVGDDLLHGKRASPTGRATRSSAASRRRR